MRAQAHEKVSTAKGEKPVAAATDYLDLYDRFPLNDEAKLARRKFRRCKPRSASLSPACLCTRRSLARKRSIWPGAGVKPAPNSQACFRIVGRDHQRADLRIVQCEVELGGKLEQLSEISLTDPELDAERVFSIAQAHRG